MNQNTLIGGIILILLILLGIWYFSSANPSGSPVPQQIANTPAATVTPSTPNTFRSIFTQSGNHQCSYSQVQSAGQTSSVIYIADGKMRGEFRTMGVTPSANLMIYSEGILYSWKEGASVGKKSSIKSIADLPQAIPSDLTSGAIFGANSESVGWDCHDWAKDVKLFTVPAYVKFS